MKRSSEQVLLNNFCWVPISCHRKVGRSSSALFKKFTRTRCFVCKVWIWVGVFGLYLGFKLYGGGGNSLARQRKQSPHDITFKCLFEGGWGEASPTVPEGHMHRVTTPEKPRENCANPCRTPQSPAEAAEISSESLAEGCAARLVLFLKIKSSKPKKYSPNQVSATPLGQSAGSTTVRTTQVTDRTFIVSAINQVIDYHPRIILGHFWLQVSLQSMKVQNDRHPVYRQEMVLGLVWLTLA